MVEKYDWLLNYSKKIRTSTGLHELSFVTNCLLKLECKISKYPSQRCQHIKINSPYVIFFQSWFSLISQDHHKCSGHASAWICAYLDYSCWKEQQHLSSHPSITNHCHQAAFHSQYYSPWFKSWLSLHVWRSRNLYLSQTHPNMGISSSSQCLTSQDTMEFL